ncbi:MAG: hypothetical protein P8N51_10335 [Pseudomonadales bacterium]|nr:hypothetical protein [Pseudomonadales bacterium]MDG1442795.1 hypothetical protein [Pseudomonadales bacterium]
MRRSIGQRDPSVLDGLGLDFALNELSRDPMFDELLRHLEAQENNTDAYQLMSAASN